MVAYLSGVEVVRADWSTAIIALNQESKIKELQRRDGTLLVAVVDDGSRRDGYAEYVCLVLGEHGVREAEGQRVLVKIVDSARGFGFPNERELGVALCPR
jgi:hypothetical protein